MWQKELKQLKKLLQEQSKIVINQNKPKVENEPTIDFTNYCKNLNIQPIKQDQVNLQKTAKKPLIKQPNNNDQTSIDDSSFEFLDIENSPKEFYRFGQRLLPKQLREPKTFIQRSIDTHNLTRTHALNIIESIVETIDSGSIIRIIHGMGNNSEFNQPVLMGTIRKYLTMSPRVLAFSYGSIHQGGNGVTIVKISK